MSTKRQRLTAPLAALAIATTLTLTGCFGNPFQELIEQAGANSGGSSNSGSSNSDSGNEQQNNGSDQGNDDSGTTNNQSDSNVDINLEGGSLPDGFPSDVPTPDAPIVLSTSLSDGDGKSWHVTYQPNDPEAVYNDMVNRFKSAGYEVSMTTDLQFMKMTQFTNSTYQVNLSLLVDDEEAGNVSMVVLTAPPEG